MACQHTIISRRQHRCNDVTFVCWSFQVEQFWAVYSHLLRPGEMTGHSDYHLFKEGIRPMWEVSDALVVSVSVIAEFCVGFYIVSKACDVASEVE